MTVYLAICYQIRYVIIRMNRPINKLTSYPCLFMFVYSTATPYTPAIVAVVAAVV